MEILRKEVIMKRNCKSKVLILSLITVLIFSGCSNINLKFFKDPDETNNKIEENDDNDITDTDTFVDTDNLDDDDEGDSSEQDKPTPTIIQPLENKELLIYVVNSESDLDTVTALVPADSEITPQLIVDTVVESMADQSIVIGIESVTTQEDKVIISFYSDQPPLINVGSGLENVILDALAQSITENLEDYNKIIYRVEGGPYISGHIELGIDEVYFED
jgi:hypothetical protein